MVIHTYLFIVLTFLLNCGGGISSNAKSSAVEELEARSKEEKSNLKLVKREFAKDPYYLYRVNKKNGNSCIHKAVEEGDLNTLKFLISNGGPINQVNTLGISPIELACKIDNEKIMDALLKSGATISTALSEKFPKQFRRQETKTIEVIKCFESQFRKEEDLTLDYDALKNSITKGDINLSKSIRLGDVQMTLYLFLSGLQWHIDSSFLLSRVVDINGSDENGQIPSYASLCVMDINRHFNILINSNFIDQNKKYNMKSIFHDLAKRVDYENDFISKLEFLRSKFNLAYDNGENILYPLVDRQFYIAAQSLLMEFENGAYPSKFHFNNETLIDRVLSKPFGELVDNWDDAMNLMIVYLAKLDRIEMQSLEQLNNFISSTLKNKEEIELDSNVSIFESFFSMLIKKGLEANKKYKIKNSEGTFLMLMIDYAFGYKSSSFPFILNNLLENRDLESHLAKDINIEILEENALSKSEECAEFGYLDDEVEKCFERIYERVKEISSKEEK